MYLSKFGQCRRRKLELDTYGKIREKYKRQRLMKKYQCPPQRQDSSYGDNPLNVDINMAELKRLCSEYIERLTVNDTEAKK